MKTKSIEEIKEEINEYEQFKKNYIEATPYREACFVIAFLGPILVLITMLVTR